MDASLLIGLSESVLACLADLVALSGVFVVGGDISDAFVEPYRVVLVPDAFEFTGEIAGSCNVSRWGFSPLMWLNSDSIQT